MMDQDPARSSLPLQRPHARLWHAEPSGVRSQHAGAQPNRLLGMLQQLAPEEYERLLPSLTRVELPQGHLVFAPLVPIPFVYFPEGCAASIIRIMRDGRRVEVSTTGLEGLVGLSVFLGTDRSPLHCVIQVRGTAQRIDAEALRAAAGVGSVLHGLLQRYTQYLFDQATVSTACIHLHGLIERCARWLLATHDRVPGDVFELTQAYIATMLGVHRPAVTLAAGSLQDAGLIRYRRGRITIIDRAGLENAACECYRADRDDLERLLPWMSSPA
jgi:CRP-like cAMP-binding protein